MDIMKESRRFLRFDVALKVDYMLQGEPKIERTGSTKDVCAEGMQLLTEEKLQKGDKLEFKLTVPEALNPVHLNGNVMWSKEMSSEQKLSYSSGVEFGDIEEDNKNTFLKFLCNLMYLKTGRTS
ncbi:MAG: PilZ domain-containing protein [Candidatus Omnitrophica bacterium]|nr:PilZ domain-containing protein [Candidatus Omnitrophota bacterium]